MLEKGGCRCEELLEEVVERMLKSEGGTGEDCTDSSKLDYIAST
jgi:hypothetical protein